MYTVRSLEVYAFVPLAPIPLNILSYSLAIHNFAASPDVESINDQILSRFTKSSIETSLYSS